MLLYLCGCGENVPFLSYYDLLFLQVDVVFSSQAFMLAKASVLLTVQWKEAWRLQAIS
jgi:hypothetical protein